jgi:hypothetical protein
MAPAEAGAPPSRSTLSDTTAGEATNPLLATASAEVRDLTSTVTAACPVSYGDAWPVPAVTTGTITSLPDVDDVIQPGESLYRIDDHPVLLLRGRLPAWRDLTPWMDKGRDIAQTKRALVALGFADPAEIGTSTSWNWSLSQAIADLREAAGYTRDYTLPQSVVVFAPAAVRVAALTASPGEPVAPGTQVLTLTTTTPHVTCEIETSQRAYAIPQAQVAMTFPDGTEASGAIVDVTTQAGEGPEDPDVLAAVIDVAANVLISQDTGTLARVTLTHTVATGVLAVPVTALVAFVDGGYGVAALDDAGAAVLVPVLTGRFAGTLVEITGGDIAPGDQVVVTP